jgi:hypothetical protein
MHGSIAHVAAYRSLRLAGGALDGLHVRVPSGARVRTRGATLLGMLGSPAPADAGAEHEARSFARGLVGSCQLALEARGRRGRAHPLCATHAIERIDGKRTIVRRGFAGGAGFPA